MTSEARLWEDAMEIEFEITLDDLVAFNVYHNRHSKPGKRNRLILSGFLTLAALASMSSILLPDPDSPIVWNASSITLSLLPILFMAALFGLALSPGVRRWQTKRALKRLLSEGKSKRLVGARRLTLTSTGVTHRTAVTEAETKWSAVEKLVETDQHLFIYTSPVEAFIVPRRAFVDEAQYQEFAGTARRSQAGSPM
jgi:hypothetical protein